MDLYEKTATPEKVSDYTDILENYDMPLCLAMYRALVAKSEYIPRPADCKSVLDDLWADRSRRVRAAKPRIEEKTAPAAKSPEDAACGHHGQLASFVYRMIIEEELKGAARNKNHIISWRHDLLSVKYPQPPAYDDAGNEMAPPTVRMPRKKEYGADGVWSGWHEEDLPWNRKRQKKSAPQPPRDNTQDRKDLF